MSISKKTKKLLGQLHERLAAGETGPVCWLAEQRLAVPPNVRQLSLGNTMSCYMTARSIDVATDKQWAQRGREPRPGATRVFLLRPAHIRVKVDENENGEPVYMLRQRGFTSYTATARYDTEIADRELVEADTTDPGELEHTLPQLEPLFRLLGVRTQWAALFGAAGMYRPGKSEIVLGTSDPFVACHELFHAAHNRHDSWGDDEVDKEAVADLGAALLVALYMPERDVTGIIRVHLQRVCGDNWCTLFSNKLLYAVDGTFRVLADLAREAGQGVGSSCVALSY